MTTTSSWFFWALLSAGFAALTAIFAKVGLENVNSDLATLIRTFVILLVLGAFVLVTGKWSNPTELSSRTWLFLASLPLPTAPSGGFIFEPLKFVKPQRVRTS